MHCHQVEGIAESRNLEIAKVKELIDKAPLFPMEARDSGLVDVVAYRDVAYSLLKGILFSMGPLTGLIRTTYQCHVGKVFGESAAEATEQLDKKNSKDEKVQFMSFKKYVRVTRTEKKKDERRYSIFPLKSFLSCIRDVNSMLYSFVNCLKFNQEVQIGQKRDAQVRSGEKKGRIEESYRKGGFRLQSR